MEEFKRIESTKGENEERIKELLEELSQNEPDKASLSFYSEHRSAREFAESETGKNIEKEREEIIKELKKLGHEI